MRDLIRIIEQAKTTNPVVREAEVVPFRAKTPPAAKPTPKPEPKPSSSDDEALYQELQADLALRRRIAKANRLSVGQMVRYRGRPAKIIRSTEEKKVIQFSSQRIAVIAKNDWDELKGYSESIFDDRFKDEP